MSENTFAKKILTDDQVIAELQALVGCNFPMTVSVMGGKVMLFKFDDEWQEGNPTDGYKTKKLTKVQKDKLSTWAKQNVIT